MDFRPPRQTLPADARIEPLDDRILVRLVEAAQRSPGGILLPERAQKRPQRGTVVAVGPGKVLEDGSRLPLPFVVGDVVMYGALAGTHEFDYQGAEHIFLGRDEVWAKLVPDGEERTTGAAKRRERMQTA